MSYVALYRKWRPQRFSEVVGQKVVVSIIQNAIKNGRVSHAYLFAGPRGVGKTSVARILAKALNCEKGPSVEPCNECSICKKITEGSSFDVLEIDGASNRGVDEVRALKERVNLAPVEGRYKVYIIDEVHMLTVEAFNALLKTLEEPPSHVIFILATTEPHKLPLTIRSRCQFLAFKPLEPSDMVSKLREVAESENVYVEEDVLLEIARRADGSMRDALSLLEQLLTLGENITLESLERSFGIVSNTEIRERVSLIREGNWDGLFSWLKSLKERGVMVPYLFEDFADIFRKIWLFRLSSRASEILNLSSEEVKFYASESGFWNEDLLWFALNSLERRGDRVKQGASPFKMLEMFLLDLRKKLREERGTALAEQVREKEKVEEFKKVEEKSPEAEEVAQVEKASSQKDDKWSEFLSRLKGRKISLYAFLMDADRRLQDGKLYIEFSPELKFHYEQIRKPENISILKEVAKEVFGDDVELAISMTAIEQKAGEEILASSSQEKKEKPSDIMEHPTLQTILRLFGGEVVEIDRESGEEG
ncbi:MAG: DNA polymerase III subunit gamma/tau [Synergistetes bacterium]|nr:DNA polymerase III subunit gamma/tau [Synergistota bacterium]